MDQDYPVSKDGIIEQAKKEIPNAKAKFSLKSSLDFRKYTKQIWLAGLGAFSRAEEEGNKLFDSLVKVGEELESKSVEDVDVEQTTKTVTERSEERRGERV